MGKVILITGPARCGKSEYAEKLALNSNKTVVYIATAKQDEHDIEWQTRIQQHRKRRPQHWFTQEVPTALTNALVGLKSETCILVDSLGTWVANLLEQEDAEWDNTVQEFLNTIELFGKNIDNADAKDVDIIFVAEETGWGVVPAYLIGRKFRDRLGALVRRLGNISHQVYLVTGGHVLNLSILGTPLD
ncbi:MAG: bifunctional adenosylcobinamide kinase/adenosylcobinamide-phosphate guanylyltransferase [Calothrix sp. C42_A2020_038]|nr:bifunctional adenosylcobinamide kinase/adenosylcobinamide-phosphate guanylyltransferase [Calothrix sp. C42_A2020_038]